MSDYMFDPAQVKADIADSRLWFWKKLPFDALIFITAPFVFIFVPKEWDRIPSGSWFRYWQCYHYGIDGDPYWRDQYGGKTKSWWRRVLWCWRNANYYDNERGVAARDIVRVEMSGESKVGNRPLVYGELAIHAWDKDGKRYWCYYTVKKSLIPGRCSRSVIGWKLKDVSDEQAIDGILGNDPNVRSILQRVFTWNPVMGYSVAS